MTHIMRCKMRFELPDPSQLSMEPLTTHNAEPLRSSAIPRELLQCTTQPQTLSVNQAMESEWM